MRHETRERLSAFYAALTEAAEHEIRALVNRGDPEARFMASGVWHMWYALTCGYQQDGDTERLESLIHGAPRDHQPSEN